MFPAPTPSYTSSGFIGDLIYIPKYNRNEEDQIIQFEKVTEKKSTENPFVGKDPGVTSSGKDKEVSSPNPLAL